MKIKSLLVLAAGLCLAAHASFAVSVDLPKYGFTMDMLDADLGTGAAMALTTSLPAVGGISPNVTVMIQPYNGNMKDYITLSKTQFDKMNIDIIAESNPGDEWISEYHGTLKDYAMHWYARAILVGTKLYVITATSPESAWPSVSADLKKCVMSFALNK